MINKNLKLTRCQTIGLIANTFIEDFFKRDFKIKKMNIDECEDIIERNNIEIIFIENDIYEKDHDWFGYSLKKKVDYFKMLNVNIIIVNTSEDLRILNNDYFQINFSSKYDSVCYFDKLLTLPFMVNEKLSNPVNVKKVNDIVLLNLDNIDQDVLSKDDKRMPKSFDKFMKTVKPKLEIINKTKITRSFIENLAKKIKKSKVLYINYSPSIPKNFLHYIALTSVLQNTTVVLDPQFDLDVPFTMKTSDPESNMNFLQSFLNDGPYNDHRIIKSAREVFLNNTLIRYPFLNEILNGNTERQSINISVVSSIKRKWTIEECVSRLNQQNNVNLEVVLLTHGFKLSEKEIKKFKNQAAFPLIIISASSNIVYGACLNMCLDKISYEYFTKMDDDDFYYPNYLIDSWIGLKYSGADIVGKHSQFVYMEEEDLTVQRFKSRKHIFSEYIAEETLFCKTEYIKNYMFSEIPKAVESDLLKRIQVDKGKIYCTHPYEFCIYRPDGKGEHTWTGPDTHLLRSADILFYGNPEDTISVN